ncbi:CocE/NonD family hydrolase [Mesorhizobium caraganae]|uniref:CocE/NonD family hydrolase n=1 Tax=Mesorhizobium caraganae TaxID=483206 RepID=UPI001AEEC1B8|nr:CocE/NonD family hydrolase [Mesorhizobium caraganae]
MIDWLTHQRRDDFWKHGSVCEDYSAIDCAVFAVGGWGDGFSNVVFRLLSNLNAPCKGLIAPWGHKYPHVGVSGHAVGLLQECLRWWDDWLKGEDTGIMQEPMLRSWMLDSVEPAAHYDERPGHWVADPNWPSPHGAMRELDPVWLERRSYERQLGGGHRIGQFFEIFWVASRAIANSLAVVTLLAGRWNGRFLGIGYVGVRELPESWAASTTTSRSLASI